MKRTRTGAMLPAVIMIVALFAIFTSVLRMWQINNWNATLRESFVSDGGGVVASMPYSDEPSVSEFSLNRDIKYYDAPGGNLALTVQANNYLRPGSNDATNECYGWHSLPTDVKGWRLSKPFGTESTLTDEMYYVKLSDLQKAAKDALGDSANNEVTVALGLNKDDEPDMLYHDGDSSSKVSRVLLQYEQVTLRNDVKLYCDGEFLSSDLYAPVWNTMTTGGFVMGIALCLWAVVMFILRSREGGKAK